MKKICIFILFTLVFAITCYGSSHAQPPIDKSVPTTPEDEFINNIEKGTVDAGVFTLAVERRHFILRKISPSAIANYMEALANDGILKLIPAEYYNDDEVNTALDVVFEDRANITNNWDVFENQWLPAKICR